MRLDWYVGFLSDAATIDLMHKPRYGKDGVKLVYRKKFEEKPEESSVSEGINKLLEVKRLLNSSG